MIFYKNSFFLRKSIEPCHEKIYWNMSQHVKDIFCYKLNNIGNITTFCTDLLYTQHSSQSDAQLIGKHFQENSSFMAYLKHLKEINISIIMILIHQIDRGSQIRRCTQNFRTTAIINEGKFEFLKTKRKTYYDARNTYSKIIK